MELPQSRPFRAEGRKATVDFLSLCSPVQQDPRHPQEAGGCYLKTHDFMEPLNQAGKNEENNVVDVRVVEKPPQPAPPPSMTRIPPGGIGSYSISFYDRTVPKPEGTSLFTVAQSSSGGDRNDENSNSSSYTSATATKKTGKTGKENIAAGGRQWTPSLEQLAQTQKKNQSFLNMLTSSRIAQQEDDDDEDEDEFVVKKEPSSHPHLKGNLPEKVDGKSIIDQKPNTPRSKHSATEQRRRSKINDRFQRLREIIPHSDQKRDKASFLLEVIEYIQYLQEKELRYEGSCQGWNHEPSKMMPLGNCYRSREGLIDQSHCTTSGSGQALVFAAKIDNNNNNNVGISQTIPINGQKLAQLDTSNIAASKERCQQPEVTNKAVSYPSQLQQNIFPLGRTSNIAASHSPGAAALDTNKMTSHFQSKFWQSKSCTTTDSAVPSDHKRKEHEETIESGTISISSVYSQGLLSSLTHALQNSGVDLSHASISVQIDLGKRAKSNEAIGRPLTMGSGEESNQPLKRLKASRA